MSADRLPELKRANELLEGGDPDGAWDIVNSVLMDNPHDPRAIMLATSIQNKARRLTIAYQFAERGVLLAPNICEMWLNLGRAADQLYRVEEAERAYLKGLEVAIHPRQKALLLSNLGALYVNVGQWQKAEELTRQALAIEPESRKSKANLGLSCLAQRKWVEGWVNYDEVIGFDDSRKLVKYGDEPTWNGQHRQTVAIYGEQGLGDEISFASMIPDAVKDSKKVIIDCDKRLRGLFQRSFPEAKVYGTRWSKAGEALWAPEDRKIDASISMGGLGKHYRRKDYDFPGTPYLKADPERVTMWKALFASQGKPSIGVAWTGGVQWTASKYRQWDLPGLYPLFCSVNAHWVSLQYKDASKELRSFHNEQGDVQVHQYPYGTLTQDYDDTAALVASLDLVICMQTAVAHLAGALGKECWVFVPKYSQWRYGSEGDSIPWYKSVKVFRQDEKGSWPLGEASRILRLRYLKAA